MIESNYLATTPLNKAYRVTAGNGEHTPKIGGEYWDRTSHDISRRIYSPLPHHCGGFSILVGPTGIEPVRNYAADFKSAVATYYTTVP